MKFKKSRRNLFKGKNKGFTLVELIVVIVILAILVGVTLGGIYAYVNKARINTDMYNAKVVQDMVFNALISDESMFKERYKFKAIGNNKNLVENSVNNGNLVVLYHWTDGGYLKYDNGWFFFDKNNEKQKGMDWSYMNGPLMQGEVAPEFPHHGAWTLFRVLAKNDIIPSYPTSQSGQIFWLAISFDENGMTQSVHCTVSKDTNQLNIVREFGL